MVLQVGLKSDTEQVSPMMARQLKHCSTKGELMDLPVNFSPSLLLLEVEAVGGTPVLPVEHPLVLGAAPGGPK